MPSSRESRLCILFQGELPRGPHKPQASAGACHEAQGSGGMKLTCKPNSVFRNAEPLSLCRKHLGALMPLQVHSNWDHGVWSVLNVYCLVLKYAQREKVLSLTSGPSSLPRCIVLSPFKCAVKLTGKLAGACIWWHTSSHELCLWSSVATLPPSFRFFVWEKSVEFMGRAKCHSTCSVDCDFLWKLISSMVGTGRKPSCLLLGRGWTWVSGAPSPEL